MISGRTDLASEAREVWQKSAEKTSKLEGVSARQKMENGFSVETVKIFDERGETALEKPRGIYVSIDILPMMRREENAFVRAAELTAEKLRQLLKLRRGESALVCGMGNYSMAADRVGPLAARHTLATRHLKREDKLFAGLRPVAVVEAGVLGTTGVESAEIVHAVAQKVKPAAIIVIDALASLHPERLCRSLQLSNAGIVPGSGVGNARQEISRKTMGMPVVAIGVPTVADASKLAKGLVITPRDIDARAAECGRLIGSAINMALHNISAAEAVELLQCFT